MYPVEYLDYVQKHLDPTATDAGFRSRPSSLMDELFNRPGTLRISLRTNSDVIRSISAFVTEENQDDI